MGGVHVDREESSNVRLVVGERQLAVAYWVDVQYADESEGVGSVDVRGDADD